MRRHVFALGLSGLLLLSACSAAEHGHIASSAPASSTAADQSHSGHGSADAAPAIALRDGEQRSTSTMTAPYTPTSRNGASDDYRCFLVDPAFAEDRYLTGVRFNPGNASIVHHVILFRVDPSRVQAGREKDASDPGEGWTCFGGPGFQTTAGFGGAGSQLTAAPWLAAWAPGGKEQVWRDGLGVRFPKGSQAVLQVHYNLRAGDGEDVTSVDWRTMPISSGLTDVDTRLLVAPVELPCAPDESGPLCDRTASIKDTAKRFGDESGLLVTQLQYLCGGNPLKPKAGPVQSCDYPVRSIVTIYSAAAHMHLLGRSMTITLNPDGPNPTTLLDVPSYDFDQQGAIPLAEPVVAKVGDTLRITCTHDVSLRSKLPAFDGLEPRYVTWGEGTTDEMCLGILSYSQGA